MDISEFSAVHMAHRFTVPPRKNIETVPTITVPAITVPPRENIETVPLITVQVTVTRKNRYGSVSPKTSWGKMVTIIYALVGIPLMLLYLSTTGDLLARSFRRLYGKLCGVSNQKPQCPCTNPVRVPVTLCLIIVLAYICSGAVLFHRLENWSLLEGSYFCFTSLGTIGFGDLLPGQNAEEISLCACSAYILTGMALVAMCFSLVQDEVINLLRYIGATCTRNKMLKRPQTEGAAPIKRPPMVNKIPPMLQHNSLPRKSNFQRNTPARRSAGAEPLIEYFVPRSVSEFDLSIATGDTPITGNFLPLTVRVPRKMQNKQKEKMVTFEDEMAVRLNKDPELQDTSVVDDFNTVKRELKQFKNLKLCEGLKKCDENCSCNAEAECDICKVIDFTMKKDKL
ncbi:hypothetical protein Zmor_017750 [Zophobas morio]|uniref:Potassium channel domain-containing protein n=1 Tax=Zophobas morio TaxID=2755281 RepID=A0AA38IC28_9CUCU|nr:hypothetical protein Zmor_017750 [Zophobas morio]